MKNSTRAKATPTPPEPKAPPAEVWVAFEDDHGREETLKLPSDTPCLDNGELKFLHQISLFDQVQIRRNDTWMLGEVQPLPPKFRVTVTLTSRKPLGEVKANVASSLYTFLEVNDLEVTPLDP